MNKLQELRESIRIHNAKHGAQYLMYRDETECVPELCAEIDQLRARIAALEEDKRREREQAHLHVIALLSMAKGYASANPVGNNWKMCEEAGAWLVSALSANPRLLSEGGEGK